MALLIAALDHFSGKLLFVISDSCAVATSSFMRLWLCLLAHSLLLVCYLPLARLRFAARVSSQTIRHYWHIVSLETSPFFATKRLALAREKAVHLGHF